jgi:lipoyl-dependent peroxiredoxin
VQSSCGYPATSVRGTVELYGLPIMGRAPRAAVVIDGYGLTGLPEEAKMTVRSGTAEWHGDVESGSGTVTVGDGVFEGAYSYDSRFGEGKGTNPEQLIAAAHASCFTMALSNVLSAAGHPPESLRTNARVQLRNLDGVPTLARITLDTEGRVTGIDERQFQAYADEAKRVCPVSRALAGIPEIVLTAKLAAGQ